VAALVGRGKEVSEVNRPHALRLETEHKLACKIVTMCMDITHACIGYISAC
jgi:hypothetical protein